MRKSIEVLPQSSFKSVLSKPDEGLVAFTYLCLLDWPDGKKRQCFVKIFSLQQSIGVFNEILGYLLTKFEDLPVASKAGILILPDQIKVQIGQPVASVAFVTSRIDGKTPSSFYRINDMLKFNSLCNVLNDWDKLHQSIAFDEWVANQDRNLGNVVISTDKSITLIDHSNMPVDLNWTPAMLDTTLSPQNKLGDFFRPNPTLPQKLEILKSASGQRSNLEKAKEEIVYWADRLLTTEQKSEIMKFLEVRADQSNMRLSKKYGVLAGVA
ncbi:hypothetical protein [Pantoea ananatis]|uniref:hypothetical protein n=1 Tax=Pantoea ananas TaxID=553 RepID=UPI000E2308E5|nr:hypothetical protein [Pantoea ananatis]REE77880.1 hypothetical protein C7424_0901 [Pantoea ananatis]BBL31197.1 hypothetical protein PAFU01_26450 [Pantoea ananatis]